MLLGQAFSTNMCQRRMNALYSLTKVVKEAKSLLTTNADNLSKGDKLLQSATQGLQHSEEVKGDIQGAGLIREKEEQQDTGQNVAVIKPALSVGCPISHG